MLGIGGVVLGTLGTCVFSTILDEGCDVGLAVCNVSSLDGIPVSDPSVGEPVFGIGGDVFGTLGTGVY